MRVSKKKATGKRGSASSSRAKTGASRSKTKAKAKLKKVKNLIKKSKSKKDRARLRAKIINENMPKENTKPELLTRKLLEFYGITYTQQQYCAGYYFDFYLPEYKIMIEVNGDYFHANPLKYKKSEYNYTQKKNHRRDKKKLGEALSRGYTVIYIWESDLKTRFRKTKKHFSEIIAEYDTVHTQKVRPRHVHLMEHVFPQYASFYVKKKKLLTENSTDINIAYDQSSDQVAPDKEDSNQNQKAAGTRRKPAKKSRSPFAREQTD